MMIFDSLPEDWRSSILPLAGELSMRQLSDFVQSEYATHTVYPPQSSLFRAFRETPLSQVKVVILGQDPYHEPDQACGLAFSVPDTTPAPPSLKNILKEYADDLNVPLPDSRDLGPWARQGVLLLNTVLTVRKGAAASHAKHGWELFTDAAIRTVSLQVPHAVFILWGGPAAKKIPLIDARRHTILTSPHPSPLSSYRGFFGSKPFSKANAALSSYGIAPIDWTLLR